MDQLTSQGVHGERSVEVDKVRDRRWQMLVGGRLLPGSGDPARTVDPATGEVIAEVPDASESDVAAAVEAAQEGFARWRTVPLHERTVVVRRLADLLMEHQDELAFLDALDSGNAITAMKTDVRWAWELTNLLADTASELRGETVPATARHLHYTVREPYGVVARIVPFNHPLMFAAAKIVAPLLAGNSVVLKASEQTPLSALRMGEILAAELPAGVLNVLTGVGAGTGRALVRHPAVRRIAFIGSAEVGRAIQRDAADVGVKHVSLELGGKNAMLVFPDADPEEAAASAFAGMNFRMNQGQSCGSTSRLLVHESIADEVVERVCEATERIRIGSPLDPDVEMGPLISARHHERVTGFIERAQQEGASLRVGGGRPAGLDTGFFLAPTVFSGVQRQMEIASREVFGPVLSVMTWTDEAEAIRVANGVEYGLTASIWTNDVRRAHRVARELEAGYLWINGASAHFWGMPFGGMKSSGLGREESAEELISFTQSKAVNVLL